MSELFAVLLLIVISIHIGTALSRGLLELLFFALGAAAPAQQAPALSSPPVAVVAAGAAENIAVRLAA